MKKIYIAIALFSLYIASPYYAVYSFINCLNDGDTIGLKKVVDFPALRESLKDEMKSKLVQQTKRSISSKEEEFADKLVSGMGAMFGPAIIDGLVDTFVTPSGLAGLISNPSSALDGENSKNDNKIPNISWAFFSGLTDFQAKITDKQETLTMHFCLTNFRWMLYAITWNHQNSGNSGVDLLETVKPEKTDTSSAIPPLGAMLMHDSELNEAMVARAESDIEAIEMQLRTYEMLNYKLPTTEQGLAALVKEPTIEPKPRRWRCLMRSMLTDPWGSDYVYQTPSKDGSKAFALYSLGPDKKESGDDIGK